MKHIMKAVSVLGIVVLLAAVAAAQSAATADLHVTVKDPKGAIVKNATVTARDEARNLDRKTTTNVEGIYSFLLLPPGSYTLTVEATGFAKVVNRNVVLTVGQRAELPVTLQVAAVSEVVDVNAAPELVETERTSSTQTIESVRIDNLPINGRNYIQFAETDSRLARDTTPSIGAAPTSGLNFGGQRARSNLVNVDGMDAVDNSVNGIRSTVSQEAVQEFQIQTSGYSAEYGRASGGVINIVTKGGTNTFHGSAFGYLRNRHFQAVNPFSTVPDPAYTRVQAGMTLGGPIKKDKTFYFFSYETTRRQETGFSSIGQNNFDLKPLTIAPGVTGLFTADQIAFITSPTTQAMAAADPVFAATLNKYVQLAAGSSAVALTGNLPGVGSVFAPTVTCTAVQPPFCGAVGQPILIPLPASYHPLQSVVGNFPVSEGTSIWSGRIDHKLNDKQNLNLRVSVSPSTVTGIQVASQGGVQNFGQNAGSATSLQNFRDVTAIAQHTWTNGTNMVNEFSFQFARRGLLYNYSQLPGGSDVRVQIAGYAFLGREPYSFVRRTEKRFQFKDNFSITKGKHAIKFGADVNHLPLEANFSVNFGGLYAFSSKALFPAPFPAFSPVQVYGVGIPDAFIQGVGNDHDKFTNGPIGAFIQDTWRITSKLTLNYGVRYDVEFTPTFKAVNPGSEAAENALGITQGIPRDYNNVAPRIGLAWDPQGNGKTVVRASYGIFYDHPLLALAFDSDVADGSQAPQLEFFGGTPTPLAACDVTATNIFQGTLSCPPNYGYVKNQQRFNAFMPNSIWVNQNYLTQGQPLVMQPFSFPVAKDFQFAYSNQANLTIERDLGHNFALGVEYNFNGGRHLNRPINFNAGRPDLLYQNWQIAKLAGDPTALQRNDPRFVGSATSPCGAAIINGALVPWVNPAIVSFFRPSGMNPSFIQALSATPNPCLDFANRILAADHLGVGANGGPCNPLAGGPMGDCVPIPFSDTPANYSNGSSVYHGMTVNLKKRFSKNYEFLASYTLSHAIDDSTDLESPLVPADNYHPERERSNSIFDQRHRFVFSAVYRSGKMGGQGFVSKLLSNWTVAPFIDVSSGRPFNILVGGDRNFDFTTGTDRPRAVAPGTPTSACGDAAVASKFSPTGFFQPPCYLDNPPTFNTNLGRNVGTKPTTVSTDMRIARRIALTERVNLDAIADMFNLINRFNVLDVNPLWNEAGRPAAAMDPRQFQFALKLSW